MSPEYTARQLSEQMRNFLLDHACGPRPIDRVRESHAFNTRVAMVSRGLVRAGSAYPADHCRAVPSHTHITSKGRAVMAFLLGEYAEILCRLGYNIQAPGEHRTAGRNTTESPS